MYLQRKDTTFLPGLQVFLQGNRFFLSAFYLFQAFSCLDGGKEGEFDTFFVEADR